MTAEGDVLFEIPGSVGKRILIAFLLSNIAGVILVKASHVRIIKIDKNFVRPGSAVAFHRVQFEVLTESMTCSHVWVWVSQTCHASKLERVAHELLRLELEKLSQAVAATQFELQSSSHVSAPAVQRAERKRNNHAQLRGPFRIARYVLQQRSALPCNDLQVWKSHIQSCDRWVDDTSLIDVENCRVRVCTVFVGVDMGLGTSEPVLFETIILGGRCDRTVFRYRSWDEAAMGHATVVRFVQSEYDDSIRTAMKAASELTKKTFRLARRLEKADIFATSSGQ